VRDSTFARSCRNQASHQRADNILGRLSRTVAPRSGSSSPALVYNVVIPAELILNVT
jgi:hypothetical protein